MGGKMLYLLPAHSISGLWWESFTDILLLFSPGVRWQNSHFIDGESEAQTRRFFSGYTVTLLEFERWAF